MTRKARKIGIDDVIAQGLGAADLNALPRRDLPAARRLTDLGNAERLVAAHRDRIVYVPQWGWLVWDGCRWARDEGALNVRALAVRTVREMYVDAARLHDREARQALIKHALASENRRRLEAIAAVAEPLVSAAPSDFDRDPWFLNVLDGTVDLKTGKLRAHAPGDRLTKLAPVHYDPNAVAPTFDNFLERILPDADTRRFVQRAVGYALTGDTRDQVFNFWHGVGANGKSTLLRTLGDSLGDYAQAAPAELLLRKKDSTIPNDVARLRAARFVTVIELESGRRVAEAFIKQLTGGDKIPARFLNREWFEFVPEAKFFIAANHKPNLRGTEHALWRRVRLVPFDVVIPDDEQDKALLDKLRAELPGILAWAIRGCREWQAEGLGMSEGVRTATATYRREQDVLGDFLDECCELRANATVAMAELYRAYQEWCMRSGDTPLSKKAFGSALTDQGYRADKDSTGARIRRGLALREGPL